ncbi:MAG TPA: hypothetical protein VNA04_09960 [Thermoanaerobaculia bacterium]|nr:hypothetical protein [Thermoanaerobaculia bacterium]
MAIWLEVPDHDLLLARIIDPQQPVRFEETFVEATQATIDGRVRRRPATIRVPEEEQPVHGSGGTRCAVPSEPEGWERCTAFSRRPAIAAVAYSYAIAYDQERS